MKSANKFYSLALVVLLVATIYGLIRTGRGITVPAQNEKSVGIAPERAVRVDQQPLLTAQSLAQIPATAVEVPFAQAALRLGDQEMDLAFARTVLDATQHPPALSAEAKDIETRLLKAEDALAAEQRQVAELTRSDGKAGGARKDALDDQLQQAKAELELRQDEVDDAKEDLIRAGGAPQDRIQAMVREHEEASQASDATKVATVPEVEPHGLVQRFQQWSELHQKQLQLWRAKQDAIAAAAAFAAEHDALNQQLGTENDIPTTVTPAGAASTHIDTGGNKNSEGEDSAAILRTTKRRSSDQKTLAILDKRNENETQLATIYGQWIAVVAVEQQSSVHGGLRGVLAILLVAVIGLFVNGWIATLLGKRTMERRQLETLRTVTGVTLQIVGVLLILLIIFGRPTQLGTVLGLAGAGLTVALKDFIVAFVGWFVLMRKDGIRIGDWVEINGVTGEVVEFGMFHTVLLETGNWTDSGHPTGRRVTFTNSYAVEGHYFRFSTSGQWLWDELKIVLPSGHDLYPIVEAVQKKVLEATSEGARLAEEEWHGATKSPDMKTLSAEPGINVKPVIGGTEISVRYVTRANELSQLRAKLNRVLVDLLVSRTAPQSDSGSLQPAMTVK